MIELVNCDFQRFITNVSIFDHSSTRASITTIDQLVGLLTVDRSHPFQKGNIISQINIGGGMKPYNIQDLCTIINEFMFRITRVTFYQYLFQ